MSGSRCRKKTRSKVSKASRRPASRGSTARPPDRPSSHKEIAMAANKKVLLLPGDGIGPEVTKQVMRIVDWFDKRRAVRFDMTQDLVGGAAYEKHGTPITDKTMETAHNTDAVLFGAVGGPQWDSLPFDKKPERGLLRLRKELNLFANLRP